MNEIRIEFNRLLKDHFNDKVVGGPGANWGTDLPVEFRGKVSCYFDQLEIMRHPSISTKAIQVIRLDELLDPGMGIEQFKLDVIIRAEPERQGWSICAALEKELRSWLGTVNHERQLTAPGYAIDVRVGRPTSADFIDEGDLIAYHVIVPITYVRPQEVNQ